MMNNINLQQQNLPMTLTGSDLRTKLIADANTLVEAINLVAATINTMQQDISTGIATTSANAITSTTKAAEALISAANAAASANNTATAVVNQLTAIKTQTEAARDQALAGLGAADNSQILSELLGDSGYLLDMVGQAIKELFPLGLTPLSTLSEQYAVHLAAAFDLAAQAVKSINGGNVAVALGDAVNPSISIFGNRNTGIYSPAANQLAVTTAGVQRLLIDAIGNHLAGTDNAQTLGSAAKRWSTVYAGTGTINTSDAREKTTVATLTADEIAAARDLSCEVGTYQFLASIEAKGDAARRHVGLTVQRAIEIMQLHGLDPMRYGFICFDRWPAVSIEHPAVEATPDELDADGNVIQPGSPAQDAWVEVVAPAGDRYSFRYDQLNLFISAGLNARLAALESI